MVNEKYKELAMKVKIARIEHFLTQRDLAVKSGVSETAIISLENQTHRTSVSVIVKLARALDVEPSEWLKIVEK